MSGHPTPDMVQLPYLVTFIYLSVVATFYLKPYLYFTKLFFSSFSIWLTISYLYFLTNQLIKKNFAIGIEKKII